MAQILELFALVEKQSTAADAPILKIVRTYENKPRADQDLELLSEIHRDGAYAVITVQHID